MRMILITETALAIKTELEVHLDLQNIFTDVVLQVIAGFS